MPLKDLLKKKERIRGDDSSDTGEKADEVPEFTIIRSDTNTQEVIRPPTFASDVPPGKQGNDQSHKRFSRLRSASNASTTSQTSNKGEKRLSQRFHLRSNSRGSNQSSINVPTDLPEIQDLAVSTEEDQTQWEKRATLLAKGNPYDTRPRSRKGSYSRPTTPTLGSGIPQIPPATPENDSRIAIVGGDGRSKRSNSISDAQSDESIQEAIRLHESGELGQSTAMFGRLAHSNAMAQILYGLALRHGWGVNPDPILAVRYLSAAASNSADVEATALDAGIRKGGAAKGELVLAIYELANSFRHGWGVEKDAVAARKYYECAANLGDADAMNEVARCYEQGIGGSKDKYTAAQYYRLAEKNGNKTLGNSWIWKDKYNDDGMKTEAKAKVKSNGKSK